MVFLVHCFNDERRYWCGWAEEILPFWKVRQAGFNQRAWHSSLWCICKSEWATGWWFQTFFIFHFIYGTILPIDFHMFQDGYCTTNHCSTWAMPGESLWLWFGRSRELVKDRRCQKVKRDINSRWCSFRAWVKSQEIELTSPFILHLVMRISKWVCLKIG